MYVKSPDKCPVKIAGVILSICSRRERNIPLLGTPVSNQVQQKYGPPQ